MAYTTIDQLTRAADGKLENGKGNYDPSKTLYYGEDIKKVINQLGFAHLEFVNVVFERRDGTNEDEFEITVLAGKNKNGEILKNVALGWPKYYHQVSQDYQPGNKLTK